MKVFGINYDSRRQMFACEITEIAQFTQYSENVCVLTYQLLRLGAVCKLSPHGPSGMSANVPWDHTFTIIDSETNEYSDIGKRMY